MDFVLFEQWLCELMPKEHKHAVKQLVECIQENPTLQFMVGMNTHYPSLVNENPEVRAAALNGIMIGVCLYHAWKNNSFVMETSLKGFLDHQSKKRGENIVDFFTERAKKK